MFSAVTLTLDDGIDASAMLTAVWISEIKAVTFACVFASETCATANTELRSAFKAVKPALISFSTSALFAGGAAWKSAYIFSRAAVSAPILVEIDVRGLV